MDFDQIDGDGDGRISSPEFTRSTLSSLGSSMSSTSAGSSQRSSTGGSTGASTGSSTGGRSGASTGVSGGSQGQGSAELFRQYDRNNDGFLSRDELKAGQGHRSGSGNSQR